jgi:integrase
VLIAELLKRLAWTDADLIPLADYFRITGITAAGTMATRIFGLDSHSCGTTMHLRAVPLAVIAKWLGHADAATTARLYAHSQDSELELAGKTWDQL